MGSPPDHRAHVCHAQLGNGDQEVVSGLQGADLLRQPEGAPPQEGRVDQAELIPRLHHFLQASHPRPRQFQVDSTFA